MSNKVTSPWSTNCRYWKYSCRFDQHALSNKRISDVDLNMLQKVVGIELTKELEVDRFCRSKYDRGRFES